MGDVLLLVSNFVLIIFPSDNLRNCKMLPPPTIMRCRVRCLLTNGVDSGDHQIGYVTIRILQTGNILMKYGKMTICNRHSTQDVKGTLAGSDFKSTSLEMDMSPFLPINFVFPIA